MFGNNQHRRKFHPTKILFFVLVFIAFAAALGWVVMQLWNFVLVEAVGVKPLNYWKALGLLVLAKILFGSFSRRPGSWNRSKRAQWREKWINMSDEERKQFKSKWKERCRKRGERKEDDNE